MSEKATLSSKLRILVARAYKAERLYASMKAKAPEASNIYSRRLKSKKEPSALQSNRLISELSSEARATEWQQSYKELRLSLNEILEKNNLSASKLSKPVTELYNNLAEGLEETRARYNKISKDSFSAFENKEFLRCSKNSIELIRLKARIQSQTAVAEELSNLLNSSNRAKNRKRMEHAPVLLLGNKPLGEDLDTPPSKDEKELEYDDFKIAVGDLSNVIPFKR